MSEPASISTGIASRYAKALFELAQETGDLTALETDVTALKAALAESDDLRRMINSPIYAREAQESAITAVARKAGLSTNTTNTLGLMGAHRRLFVLPQLLAELSAMIADAKGEVTADVTAASAMTDAQQAQLAETLKERFGKDIKINVAVDENLIGGLVVRVGSKMIDTSIRAKLANLSNAMKEVG
ncbi:MAG: F0F1 ATP synthase subunit delta [Pseudomonadota bacterium]